MNAKCMVVVAGIVAAGLAGRAAGQQHGEPLTLDMDAAYQAPEPDAAPAGAAEGTKKERIPFGSAGSAWLTFGGGVAYDLGEETDYNLHVAYSHFLADELEFAVEVGGWYFAQDQDDTGGISGQMIFRWHFWHTEGWEWSAYGEVGIGLLAGFDEVPNGGQEFNFVPRAGGGITKRLSPESEARLQLGLRWHHISNGRYSGDVNNPSRDSVMVYAGIMIPF